MADDPKIVLLDQARRKLRSPKDLVPSPTKAIVKDDRVWLVTGEDETMLLVMDVEAGFSLAGKIASASAELRDRRARTQDSLKGKALIMWCNSKGYPAFSYRHPMRVAERDGPRVRVERVPEDERFVFMHKAKGVPDVPDSAWFDGSTGYPDDYQAGRRFWRLVATWMPETAGYARGW